MPKKSKGQKFIFKVNDKKITDYMFELTRTVIFVFAFMSVFFFFFLKKGKGGGDSVGYLSICYKRCKCGRQFYA